MSYDVGLQVQAGTPKPDEYGSTWDGWETVWDDNYTSNCARMWRDAGFDFRDWHHKPAGEMVGPLRAAIERLLADPAKYEAMNPDNGWGSYETVIPWLEGIADACVHFDLARVWVSS